MSTNDDDEREALTLTDDEWREFQSIPDQGYSHRAWIDHKIAERNKELKSELTQRELHHFETEQLLVEAGIDPNDIESARRTLSRLTGPITDAQVEAALDSWEEHSEYYPAEGMRAALEAARKVQEN